MNGDILDALEAFGRDSLDSKKALDNPGFGIWRASNLLGGHYKIMSSMSRAMSLQALEGRWLFLRCSIGGLEDFWQHMAVDARGH